MGEQPAILIAAVSGRALAQSARRGGYLPLVTDFFGDTDTLAAAHAHARLHGELGSGIDEEALFDALDALNARERAVGIVCGTGFEDRTHLLERVAQRWPLFGNGAACVARVKNPEVLSLLCADLGIPFPEVSSSPPSEPDGWFAKRKGGAGGTHVRPARHRSGADVYYQRKVPGTPVAALFLADGRRAIVLGFSTQWASPAARRPYRYGGAVRPAAIAPETAASLTAAVLRLAAALSLVGLNSADFLVEGERFWLLEINPRPGATLDIFEPPEGSLFALHMVACAGRLADPPLSPGEAKAAAIVYAENDIDTVPLLDWPDWAADRPQAGSRIEAGQPVCTVHACGSHAAEARARANKRRELVLAWTHSGKS